MIKIDKKLIEKARKAGACREALDWAEERPRTWKELVRHNPAWAVWGLIHLRLPIDLDGLSVSDRAWVMVKRRDCPIDLDGLSSYDRAWVMAERS